MGSALASALAQGAGPRTPSWFELKQRGAIKTASDLLSHLHIEALPVDVERIARALGVAVKDVSNPGWTGAVDSKGNEAIIWVRAEEEPNRRRFTIAHELGHLFLHKSGTLYRDNANYSGGEEEREANKFAAQLLMPMAIFDAIAMACNRDIATLANVFQVSKESARVRLHEWESL